MNLGLSILHRLITKPNWNSLLRRYNFYSVIFIKKLSQWNSELAGKSQLKALLFYLYHFIWFLLTNQKGHLFSTTTHIIFSWILNEIKYCYINLSNLILISYNVFPVWDTFISRTRSPLRVSSFFLPFFFIINSILFVLTH